MKRTLFKTPPDIACCYWSVLIDMWGSAISSLTPFVCLHYSVRIELAGAVMSTYSICQTASSLFFGKASDSAAFGTRRAILVLLLGSSIGLGMCVIPPFSVFVAGRALAGLFAGSASPVQSYLMATAPTQQLLTGRLKFLEVVITSAHLIGPPLFNSMFEVSTILPFLTLAGLSLTGFFFSTRCLRQLPKADTPTSADAPTSVATMQQSTRARVILVFLVAAAFTGMAQFAAMGFISVYVYQLWDWSLTSQGAVHTLVSSINLFLIRPMLDRYLRRYSPQALSIFGLGCVALLHLSLSALCKSMFSWCGLPLMLAANICFGQGPFFLFPGMKVILMNHTDKHRRGTIFGYLECVFALARAAGSAFFGWTYGRYGGEWCFRSACICTICSLLFHLAAHGLDKAARI